MFPENFLMRYGKNLKQRATLILNAYKQSGKPNNPKTRSELVAAVKLILPLHNNQNAL